MMIIMIVIKITHVRIAKMTIVIIIKIIVIVFQVHRNQIQVYIITEKRACT